MISGTVTANLEALIRLHIEDGAGQSQAIDVHIDTGFTDFMSLPVALVASLGLPWISDEYVQVADGSIARVDVHAAIVIWDGKPRKIDIHALGLQRLVGMRLLAGHDLAIRVTDGGAVSIDAIP